MNRVLSRALYGWQLGIVDPDPHAVGMEEHFDSITDIIRDGFGWGPSTRYQGDGTYKWCGAYAAWCHLPVAGVSQDLRRSMASTWRLYALGKRQPQLCVAISAIEPGDVVCVGDGDYGSHITIAVAWDKRKATLVTLSGNGEGSLFDGTWGEGVVMTVYPRTAIRAVYRFAKE